LKLPHDALERAHDDAVAGRLAEAEQALEWLTRQHPRWSAAWSELSWVRVLRRDADNALAAAQQAADAEADSPLAQFRLAEALCECGRTSEARAHYDRAVELAPHERAMRGKRLLMLSQMPQVSVRELIEAHREEGARYAAEAGPLRDAVPEMPPRDPAERLRIAYLSPDLHGHAVTTFFAPVAAAHDRTRVELHAYDTRPGSTGGGALAPHFDHWHLCAAMDDAQLTARIRADRIDLLLDLSGHTANHRQGVIAAHPARLQWQWFGYPLLTGLDAIDARVSDANLDPPHSNPAREHVVRLPSRLVWAPVEAYPPVQAAPCSTGRPFTFGSFNGLTKMNEAVLRAWTAILAAVPDSRLLLGHMNSRAFEHSLRKRLEAAGVASSRFAVLPKLPMRDYLRMHDGIDLLLDTFPYNGGTTTAHALWQGVPVLTLRGQYGPRRLGESLLAPLGLHELVARDEQDYVAQATSLGRDGARVRAWRMTMRERFAASPLGRPREVVDALEQFAIAETRRSSVRVGPRL
jgi:predicted O-linked N-acetylglucosamine transferase (SPINDLY family)